MVILKWKEISREQFTAIMDALPMEFDTQHLEEGQSIVTYPHKGWTSWKIKNAGYPLLRHECDGVREVFFVAYL